MSTYREAQRLGLTGTDKEVLNQMRALTANNINRDELIAWLSDNDYWQETPNGMIGDLTTAYDASSGGLRKKFNRVWRWLYKRTDLDELRTTSPSHAGDLLSIINKISTIDGPTRNAYFDLGGGAPYRQVTEAEYAAERTAGEAEDALEAAILARDAERAAADNDLIFPAVQTGDLATLKAAYQSAADRL